jgi:hypothetical protein
METESSLPYSQETAIGPYSEPDESIPQIPKNIYTRSGQILFFHLCLCLVSGPSFIHHISYMLRPSHSLRLDHCNNIW